MDRDHDPGAVNERVYWELTPDELEPYRAAFTLCFAVAFASFLMACLTTETRCRNVWAQTHPHA